VPIVFWSFRVMVGFGLLMIATGFFSLWLRWRRKLYETPLFARWCLVMGPSGFVALLAGWFVTETGRQPFTVYGLLRTVDSVSPIGAPGVAFSLLAFVTVYLIVFGMGVSYLLRLMRADPEAAAAAPIPAETRVAGITPVQRTHGPAP
jgi:cytochrome d ubiquinol oxidase subunit I